MAMYTAATEDQVGTVSSMLGAAASPGSEGLGCGGGSMAMAAAVMRMSSSSSVSVLGKGELELSMELLRSMRVVKLGQSAASLAFGVDTTAALLLRSSFARSAQATAGTWACSANCCASGVLCNRARR